MFLNETQQIALAKWVAIGKIIADLYLAGKNPSSGLIGERDMAWQDCKLCGLHIMADGSIRMDLHRADGTILPQSYVWVA